MNQNKDINDNDITNQLNESIYTDEKLLKLAKESFASSSSYYKNVLAPKIVKRNNMYNGIYSTSTIKNSGGFENTYFIQKPKEFVKNYVAQLVEAYNQDRIANIDPSDTDSILNIASSEFFDYIINYILKSDNNFVFNFITTTSEECAKQAVCIAKVDYDASNKKFKYSAVPIEKFRIDPNCDSSSPIESSPYLIHIHEMYGYDIMEKVEKGIWKINAQDLSNASIGNQLINDTTGVLSSKKENMQAMNMEESSFDLYKKYFIHENFIRAGLKTKVFYTAKDYKIISKIKNIEEVYPHGIPFVWMTIGYQSGLLYPNSPLDDGEPALDLLNDYANLVMESVKRSTLPITITKPNTLLDPLKFKKNQINTIITTQNPQTDFIQIRQNYNSNSISSEMPKIASQFDGLVGGFSNSTSAMQSSGSTTATEQSLKYTQNNSIIQHYVNCYNEMGFESILKLLIECIRKYIARDEKFVEKVFKKLKLKERYDAYYAYEFYGNEELALAAIQSGEFKGIVLNNDFLNQEFEINSNVSKGAISPQMRFEKLIAAFTTINNLSQSSNPNINYEEVAKEILATQGIKNYKRFYSNKVDPVVSQLNQEIAALQEKLNATKGRSPEEIQAELALTNSKINSLNAKNAEIEEKIKLLKSQTVKENVNSQFTAVQAGAFLTSIPEASESASKILDNSGGLNVNKNNQLPEQVSKEPGIQNENPNISIYGNRPFLNIQPTEENKDVK